MWKENRIFGQADPILTPCGDPRCSCGIQKLVYIIWGDRFCTSKMVTCPLTSITLIKIIKKSEISQFLTQKTLFWPPWCPQMSKWDAKLVYVIWGDRCCTLKLVIFPLRSIRLIKIVKNVKKSLIFGPANPIVAPVVPPWGEGKIWKVVRIIRGEWFRASNVVICVFRSIK